MECAQRKQMLSSSSRLVDLSTALYDGMEVYEGDPAVHITTVRTRAKDGWELREITFGSHTGTHVDAPVHMHESGATLDDIPLHRFCGPAVVVSPDDEKTYPRNTGLLFCEPVPLSAVPRILNARPPFVGGPLEEEAERALLQHGVVTYTDLVNVEQLRDTSFSFFGFPLKIKDGDGSPVRAVAIVDENRAL